MANFLKSRSDVALHFVLHVYKGIRTNLEEVTSEGYIPIVLWGGIASNIGRIWLSEMGLITSNLKSFVATPWCTVRWAVSHLHDSLSSAISFFSIDGGAHPSSRDTGNRTQKTYMFFERMRQLTDTMKTKDILREHILQIVEEVKSSSLIN